MTTATILKWGNSQGVRLSKPMLEMCDLRVGDKVAVEFDGGALRLVPLRSVAQVPDLDELFDGYEGGPVEEDGFAAAVGGEVL